MGSNVSVPISVAYFNKVKKIKINEMYVIKILKSLITKAFNKEETIKIKKINCKNLGSKKKTGLRDEIKYKIKAKIEINEYR